MIATVRVTEKGKNSLIQLKRKTGIENWNTLCRWALVTSLAESSVPPKEEAGQLSNIEMSWKTFGGDYADIYEAAFKQRLHEDQLPVSEANQWFIVHLHRGISYLNRKTSNASDLLALLGE